MSPTSQQTFSTEHSARSVPASTAAIGALDEVYLNQGPEAALDKVYYAVYTGCGKVFDYLQGQCHF